MPTTPAEERNAHLALAARVKAQRLLALADRLTAGTASSEECAEVEWEVMGKDLESAESMPVTHLAVMLARHAWQLLEVMADDPPWLPQGRVLNAHRMQHSTPAEAPGRRLVDEADAALNVQRECALLGLTRSLAECREAVEKVRKSGQDKVGWAAGARLYLGSKADAGTVRAAASRAEKRWGYREGKYPDTRDHRPERGNS